MCIALPWFLFCIFLQNFSFEVWDEKSEYIENIGYLGSFFSGATAIAVVVLTALAVFFSSKAYKQELDRVKKQRFEDHFFHLLKIHRDNVKMMEIEHKSFDFRLSENGSYQSTKAILKMFRELMQMIKVIKKAGENSEKLSSSNMRAELVYLCFYYGFGGRSGNILEETLSKYHLDAKEIEILKDYFKDSEDSRDKVKILKKEYDELNSVFFIRKITLNKKIDEAYKLIPRKNISDKAEIKYKAAGGHQTRLDHYYANLLFCFELIEEQKKNMLEEDLEIYKKELMSQLNLYEKILLIFHSNTSIGHNFQKYLLDYNFKKYIPEGMLKKEEFDLEAYFKTATEVYLEKSRSL
ncbi:putative phage abortive infection protein [Acinetobacter sp. ANC 5378]|uniref:putative phage abortive infection protein n=1 Tax=Acinetobacter sp. ANC 5378 TaxID=2731249 RepID=UPI00149026BE|nr:hypothetical protein [Acinetobacter sp. ANC 5378]